MAEVVLSITVALLDDGNVALKFSKRDRLALLGLLEQGKAAVMQGVEIAGQASGIVPATIIPRIQ